MAEIDLFIDGEYVPAAAGKRFDDVSPATGKIVASVAEAGADDTARAVAAAKRALAGPWGSMGHVARATLLEQVAARIHERFDDFVAAEMRDTGKPRSVASRVDVPRGAANFRIFAQMLRAYGTDAFEQPTDSGHALHYVQRRPLGVVGVICPWNLPLLLMTWKVAPALAAGNTVVVKPSEETPGTAALLGEIMNEVGVPPGVYNVVHGYGPGGAGEALVKHPDVAAITFTGESRTGQAIMRDAAQHVKPLSFELGGKNPAIVFADSDVDAAIAGTLRSTFLNCGQVCLCSERVYVERPIYERFVEGMKVGAAALVPGDPDSAATTLGPLISAGHREKVMGYFQIARDEGAEVITGGGVPDLPSPWNGGYYVQPTVWAGLSDEARVCREEVFGPVCHISPFDDDDEVISRANDTEYGLAAAVWTQGLKRAHRVAGALDVGMVWVNTWYLRDLRTPFGGSKMSGVGREGGRHSLEFYSELKNVTVELMARQTETESIVLDARAAALGGYPHAKRVGNLIFVSGSSSRRPDNSHEGVTLHDDGTVTKDIAAQTEATLENIRVILQAAGADLENVVDATVFLVDMKDFSGYNAVYNRYFDKQAGPARTTVAVSELPHPNLLIEIKVIAAL